MHAPTLLSYLIVTALTGAPSVAAGPPVERARYLMGTLCEARAFGPSEPTGAALDAALDRIAALEDVLTTWRPDGELARVNAACAGRTGPVRVSGDLLRALVGAREQAARTDGAFDPTIGALTSAWGLREGGRVPSDAERAAALARTSWRRLEIDTAASAVRCPRGSLELDLGGYGKGFALDEAARILRQRGVERALIDFGGQVLALGAPPGTAGWIVEIAHPRERVRPVAEIRLRDASASTSGNAENRFVVGDRSFGHLLDPRAGTPIDWPGSVTVIAPSAAAADALSTAAFVAGPAGIATILPADAAFLALEPAVTGPGVTLLAASPGLLERIEWTLPVPGPARRARRDALLAR